MGDFTGMDSCSSVTGLDELDSLQGAEDDAPALDSRQLRRIDMYEGYCATVPGDACSLLDDLDTLNDALGDAPSACDDVHRILA
jgi:hypothetical protein